MGATFFAQWFCPCGQCHHQKVFKTITWLLLSRLQGNKPHWNSPEPPETFRNQLSGTNFPEPSGTCLNLPPEPTTAHAGTLRNLPEPASGTYTRTHRNSPEPASGTYTSTHRNSPEPASGTCASTHRNSPTPSGTCLQEPTPEHTGTLRNLPPEPTPAHTGTLRNLPPEPAPAHTGTLRHLLEHTPEPSSGTFSCDPHRHTPELIWAEDPISLRCWGIKNGSAEPAFSWLEPSFPG